MSATLDLAGLDLDQQLQHEWLVSNGLGGYASSTVAGLNTRKYHGLLVASMVPPVRRMVLLSRVEETLFVGGQMQALSTAEYPGAMNPTGYRLLRKFSNDPYPRWAWQGDGWTVGRWLRLLPGRNTVCLSYFLLGCDQPAELALRPMLALRGIHELAFQWNGRLGATRIDPRCVRVNATCRTPEVFFSTDAEFDPQPHWYLSNIYRTEIARGYSGLEDLWTPGTFSWSMKPGKPVHFVCSADRVDVEEVVAELERSDATREIWPVDPAADLTLPSLKRACSVFLPSPAAVGAAVPATGFPFAAPSVRNALAGYVGLFLLDNRLDAGAALLRFAAEHLREGLVPSELDEQTGEPKYSLADASLWFAHAAHAHLQVDFDEPLARGVVLPALLRVIDRYSHGTRLGLSADPLLRTHEPNQPTTWMNAKIGDWVVTPRQGKPVELQALWYNALRIAAWLCEKLGDDFHANQIAAQADEVELAFESQFWNESAGCLFDVVSDVGRDPSVRPNQVLTMTLAFPLLRSHRWDSVIRVLRDRLLVPGGLRTLACDDPGYQGHCHGDVVARDRAYHQGCAFPWLAALLARAMVRAAPSSVVARDEARRLLEPIIDRIENDGLGLLAEFRDGDAPFAWGGATADLLNTAIVSEVMAVDILQSRPVPAPPMTPETLPTRPARVS
jgi:predicted glycogen debranching enzyme